MDTSEQLYEQEAAGWKRGLYTDVKRTFRAPIVNWIFRTTIANYPEFLRYAWGQVKPAFQTKQFGITSVEYRDTVLSELDAETTLPRYRRDDLDIAPAEYSELRGQLATYDIVASRLAVLFELVDRSLNGESVGATPDRTTVATAPLPAWLDRDRGQPPTMAGFDEAPDELEEIVPAIRSFHGLDEGLPSIYRTITQWPGFLVPLWTDVGGVLDSEDFSMATAEAKAVVSDYVDSLPYTPQLSPKALQRRGLSDEAITDLQDLFREFNRGAIETVIPTLPIYAYTVDSEGLRSFH